MQINPTVTFVIGISVHLEVFGIGSRQRLTTALLLAELSAIPNRFCKRIQIDGECEERGADQVGSLFVVGAGKDGNSIRVIVSVQTICDRCLNIIAGGYVL